MSFQDTKSRSHCKVMFSGWSGGGIISFHVRAMSFVFVAAQRESRFTKKKKKKSSQNNHFHLIRCYELNKLHPSML